MTQRDFLVNIVDKENIVNGYTMNYKDYDYKNILNILSIICKSIEVIPEIVFERIELLDDEYQNEKMIRNIPIENTRVIKIKIHFKIIDDEGNVRIDDKTGKEVRPVIELMIPRLINGTFILYDVAYYCMLQILDFKSLIRENSSTVKTLINKLKIVLKKNRKKNTKIELDLFRSKDMPLWLVLFSLYNPKEAIRRVFNTDTLVITDKDRDIDEDEYEFEYYDKIVYMPELRDKMKGLSKDDAYRTQIMFESLKEFFRDKKVVGYIEKIVKDGELQYMFDDSEKYITILGSHYTSNANKYLTKGKNVCHSLNRFLDDITKSYMEVDDMLDMFLKEIDKIHKYNENLESGNECALEENMSNNLLNKRVRLSEYIIFPFTKRLSENMHVILNSNNKDNNKIGKILNIFKIDSNIIIKFLLSSKLVRFNDQVNLMTAIFKSKASFITNDASNTISDDLRSIPKSGIGRVDLITTSNGSSCGLHFNLSATNKELFDERGIIK